MVRAAGAPDHSNPGILSHSLLSECRSYLCHAVVASDRAKQNIERFGFHTGLGKSPASGIAASAAVGTGKHPLDIIDPRIFENLELLGNKVKDEPRKGTDYT
jgi:hypothetical protein